MARASCEGFFGGAALKRPDNARLAGNIAAWAGRKPLDGLRVGACSQDQALLDLLRAAGCRADALAAGDLPDRLKDADLLWLNQASLDGAANAGRVDAVREWVRRGGGLVVAGPARGWQQLHPGQDPGREHSGSRLALPAGIAFSSEMLGATGEQGFLCDGSPPALLHAGDALAAFEAHAAGRAKLEGENLEQATATLAQVAGVLPDDREGFVARLERLCAGPDGSAIPSRQTPITRAMPVARLRAVLDAKRLRCLPPEEITAHPAAASFPGLVPADAPRDTRALRVDTARPAWHSTGLYAAPARKRPERYCVDRQISAGYMHSGYPIMTGDDVAGAFCDLSLLRGSKGIRVWGFYHELGHNYQAREWTWDAMGEVTNNLFSLYANEKLNGVTSGAHPAMTEAEIEKRVRVVRANPGVEAYYRRDPWYPLTMLLLLRRAFGWEPFTKLFAAFRDLPDGERPRSDEAKRDQFLVRLSKAVGHDLSGYLTAWGVQTSPEARVAIAGLPAWMPAEMDR